ncbi:MAG: hypothetical protein WBC19_15525 [Pyrinomonadaceae bacterium]|nr:hypothetical protein [Chloracidobacterium sp.]
MARPSALWYPTNLQDQAAWHVIFSDQAQIDGTTYGLTAGEVTQIEKDKDMVVFLASATNTIDTFVDTVRTYRKDVMELPVDGTTPTFPAALSLSPATNVPRGIWERVIEFANRIKASAGYTNAVGESYGIVGTKPDSLTPALVQPEIDLSEAKHGYLFSVVVSKREESDAWQVWLRPADSGGAYELAATGTGKALDVVYSPTTPGNPVQLEVYVQLRKNNANYGEPSEIGLVTVNP